MKVHRTNTENILSQNVSYLNTKKIKPAFRGKATASEKIIKDIYNNSSKFSRFLMKIGQNDGEILNTIVTAIGTAAVAPIFIAFNPFSKEDKDTKVYSAFRQPISAVIALIMQIGVNKGFNNYMNKKASTGGFDRADLSAKPKASYLAKIIKLEHPEYNKEQISMEVSKRQLIAEKNVINKYRKAMKDTPIEYEQLLSKDSLDQAKNELSKEIKAQHAEELSKMNSKEAKKFMEEKLSEEIVKTRAVENIKKEVEFETAAKNGVRELAKKYKTVDDAIEFMKGKQEKDNPIAKQVSKDIIERLEIIKEYEKTNNKIPFSSVKDLGKNSEEIMHNVKIKKLVRAQASDAGKVLGKYTKLLGIVVSLLTLPISCGILNWSYPRIMEKIMPQASAKKNNKEIPPMKNGGDK